MALWLVPASMLCDLIAITFIFVALCKSRRFHRAEELKNRPVWAFRQLARFQLLFMAGHVLVLVGAMFLLASTEPVFSRVLDAAIACFMLFAFLFAHTVRQYYLACAKRVEDIVVQHFAVGERAEQWLRQQ